MMATGQTGHPELQEQVIFGQPLPPTCRSRLVEMPCQHMLDSRVSAYSYTSSSTSQTIIQHDHTSNKEISLKSPDKEVRPEGCMRSEREAPCHQSSAHHYPGTAPYSLHPFNFSSCSPPPDALTILLPFALECAQGSSASGPSLKLWNDLI